MDCWSSAESWFREMSPCFDLGARLSWGCFLPKDLQYWSEGHLAGSGRAEDAEHGLRSTAPQGCVSSVSSFSDPRIDEEFHDPRLWRCITDTTCVLCHRMEILD